jgi:hypothetical protein
MRCRAYLTIRSAQRGSAIVLLGSERCIDPARSLQCSVAGPGWQAGSRSHFQAAQTRKFLAGDVSMRTSVSAAYCPSCERPTSKPVSGSTSSVITPAQTLVLPLGNDDPSRQPERPLRVEPKRSLSRSAADDRGRHPSMALLTCCGASPETHGGSPSLSALVCHAMQVQGLTGLQICDQIGLIGQHLDA